MLMYDLFKETSLARNLFHISYQQRSDSEMLYYNKQVNEEISSPKFLGYKKNIQGVQGYN